MCVFIALEVRDELRGQTHLKVNKSYSQRWATPSACSHITDLMTDRGKNSKQFLPLAAFMTADLSNAVKTFTSLHRSITMWKYHLKARHDL